MGSGGNVNAHKQILIAGAQCDMTSTVNVPQYTDVQCQSAATVIFNPYGTVNSCPNSPSFEVTGPSSRNVTFANCKYQGINTIPPYYPNRNTNPTCSSLSVPILVESASNVLVTDNLFLDTTGQAAFEGYCGSTSTPACSNLTDTFNTYDSGALYGPTFDNVNNALISHDYIIDLRYGNEMDNPNQRGTYKLNYSYIRRRTSYGYNWSYSGCGGPSTLDAFCTLHSTGQSCSETGNIIDASGTAPSGGCSSTFGSEKGLFSTQGQGGTFSQDYIYNGSGSCDSISSGCLIATPPNPAPNGP